MDEILITLSSRRDKAEWWSLYGGGCPKLAHLAIRILSQTCSAIGWKRNHIPFGQIQNTRNFLEHQRISDLVFLQYNLRLQKMLQKNKEMSPPDPIDPISFEIISSVDEWVAEKEVLSEDYGDSNWMILDQPVANTMLLISPNEEAECLDTGFEDYEIYNGIQDDEDKKVMVTENASGWVLLNFELQGLRLQQGIDKVKIITYDTVNMRK